MSGNGKGLDSDAIVIDPALSEAARYALHLASPARGRAAIGSRYGPQRASGASARDAYRALEAYTAAGRFARPIPFRESAPVRAEPAAPAACHVGRGQKRAELGSPHAGLRGRNAPGRVRAQRGVGRRAADPDGGIGRRRHPGRVRRRRRRLDQRRDRPRTSSSGRTTPTAGTCAMPRLTITAVTSCRAPTWTGTPGKSGAVRSPP